MNQTKRRLGDLLIDCNLISQEQLSQALAFQKSNGIKLGQALIEMNIVTEQDIIWALGNQLNVSFIHLSQEIVDRSVLDVVSPEFALEHKLIPLYRSGRQLCICMVDPLETEAIDLIANRTNMDISVSICTNFDFEQTFKAVFGPHDLSGKVESTEQLADAGMTTERAIPKGMEAPEKVINYILGQAIISKVEKIHFEPSEKGVVIRFRICSSLLRKLEIPLKVHFEVLAKLKSLSQITTGQGEKSSLSVGHFRVSISGRSVNVQSIFYPTIHGEMVILSINDFSENSQFIFGGNNENFLRIASFVQANHGVLYVSGPRESGRTTVNYFILNSFDLDRNKIVTVEDPVHISFPKMTQMQIGKNGVQSMKQGMEIALKLDADLIYLDYIDDKKIATDVAFAALGGKTVLTSFMAHDASSTVIKLLEMSTDSVIAATSLCGFLSLRLVRTLCRKCKISADCPPEVMEKLQALGNSPTPCRSTGCDECQKTGYTGKTLLGEFLPTSPVLRQMIIQRRDYQDIFQYARKQEIQSIEEQTLTLVANGETSIDEYLRFF
ncbi:MAG: Flp pilus assembly complex ATPase component TadA [Candidatus Riflebacteria bacterium]|nr:Flp pilus assembly complex ATPase component TadA [Candidatus Riflebacteria bacterium]